MLSEIQRAYAERLLLPLCKLPNDPVLQTKLRIGFRIEGAAVVLFESRPRFLPPHDWHDRPLAKFRYVKSRRVWQLFCIHRDLRWHVYEPLSEADDLETLVTEVRSDPTGIFWG